MRHYKVSEEQMYTLARAISGIAQPTILAIFAFLAIDYISLGRARFIYIAALSILFASVLPITVLSLWSRKKNLEGDIPQREERIVPLLIVIAIYLAGTLALYAAKAPLLAVSLMFFYFSNTLVVLFISLFWKISIHSMGVAGPTTVLVLALGPAGALLSLMLPPVIWSRLYLRRHTMAQLIMGAALGFTLTAAQLGIIYRYSGIAIDLYSLLWPVYAFIGPAVVLGVAGIFDGAGAHYRLARTTFYLLCAISAMAFIFYEPLSVLLVFIASCLLYMGISSFSGDTRARADNAR